MADENKTTIESGLSVDKVIEQLLALKQSAIESQKELSEAFNRLQSGNADAARQITTLISRIKEQSETIQKLQKDLEEMQKSGQKAFDDTAAKKYLETIARLESELKSIKAETVFAIKLDDKSTFQDINKQVDLFKSKAEDAVDGFAGALKKLPKDSPFRDQVTAMQTDAKKLLAELTNVQNKLRSTTASDFDQLKYWKDRRDQIVGQINGIGDSLNKIRVDGNETFKQINESAGKTPSILDNIKTAATGMLKQLLTSGLIIGGIALLKEGIVALGEAIFGLSREEKLRAEIAEKQIGVNLAGAKAAQTARIELDALVRIAKDHTKTEIEREAAVRKINDLMPDHIGSITLEGIETGKATTAIEEYIKSLEAKARAQAYITTLQNAYNKLIELETQFQLAGGDEAIRQGGLLAPIAKNIRNQIQDTHELITTMTDRFNQELDNGTAALDLEKQIDENLKDQIKHNKELDKLAESVGKVAAKAARDREKAERDADRAAAEAEKNRLARIRAQEEQLKRLASLEQQLAAARAQLSGNERNRARQEEDAKFEASIQNLSLLREQSIQTRRLGLIEKSAAEIKLIDENIEAQKQLHYKRLADIDKKYFDDAIKAFESAQESINDALLSDEDKAVDDVNDRFNKIIKAVEEARKKLLANVTNPIVVTAINAEVDSSVKDLENKRDAESLKVKKNINIKKIELEEDLALALNDVLTKGAVNEISLEKLKQTNKLNLIIEFAEKKKALLDPSNKEDQLAIAQLDKAIQDARKGLKGLEAEGGDLFSFLGLNDEDLEELGKWVRALGALGSVFSDVSAVIINGIDARISAQQRLIDKIDESISKQEEQVDKERELAEQGLANNLGIEETRLAGLQAAKEKEIEQEKKLRKERAALTKAQIVVDSFAQVSNLITASSEIFKALSPIPFVGVPLAIAAIGLMIGSFVAAKAQALKAASQSPEFKKGGPLELADSLKGQPSHESGGVDVVNKKSGKKLAELEGDETLYVVNKGSSAKYRPILEAINRDEFKNWTIERMLREKNGITHTDENKRSTVSIDASMVKKYDAILHAIRTDRLHTWTVANFYESKLQALKSRIELNEKRSITNTDDITRYNELKESMDREVTRSSRNRTRDQETIDRDIQRTTRQRFEDDQLHRKSKSSHDHLDHKSESSHDEQVHKSSSSHERKEDDRLMHTSIQLRQLFDDDQQVQSQTKLKKVVTMASAVVEKYSRIIDAIDSKQIHTWTVEDIINASRQVYEKSMRRGGATTVSHENYHRYKSIVDAINTNTLHTWNASDFYNVKRTRMAWDADKVARDATKLTVDATGRIRTIDGQIVQETAKSVQDPGQPVPKSDKSVQDSENDRRADQRVTVIQMMEKSTSKDHHSHSHHSHSHDSNAAVNHTLINNMINHLKPIQMMTIRDIIGPAAVGFNKEVISPAAAAPPSPVNDKKQMIAVLSTEHADLLKRIAVSNDELLTIERNRKHITDLPDKTVERKPGHTRIIHKK